MAKSPSLITPKAIALAVKSQGIDTPYWTRVVGNRLEIQPLGGQVIQIPFGPYDRPHGILTGAELRAMKRDDLRAMAREKEIDGAGTMLKAELVNALYEAKA
jgi:hypothetical protein